MTTHLSVQLAWHDRGWDGCVCDAPHQNACCIALKRVWQERDDNRERQAAGLPIAHLTGWQPPCAQDATAYSPQGYTITHLNPITRRRLPDVAEELLPYSSTVSPYRWLREEQFKDICRAEGLSIAPSKRPRAGRWIAEPERQQAMLAAFWRKLMPDQSLVFYYSKGAPLSEDDTPKIVGVGRIAELGQQLYFGGSDFPVWSRLVRQDYPQQGVRLPYQEYLAVGHPVEQLVCTVPQSARLAFSYVGEHVSDDIAISVLERVIQTIERVRVDGWLAGDWGGRLTWLNDALAEVWHGRGAFPGLGSVLQFLGFQQGTIFQREVLAPLAQEGMNPWKFTLSLLTSEIQPEARWIAGGLHNARERWGRLPPSRRELLAELARYELSGNQVQRIADPFQRKSAGFVANGTTFTDAELRANPYVIAEADKGTRNSERVTLDTIDHGMFPEGAALLYPREDRLAQDDRRRVRAVAHAVLEGAAADGDTLLPFEELLDSIRSHFAARRACLPDRDVFLADLAFHREALWYAPGAEPEQPETVALASLRRLEEEVARHLRQRAGKKQLQRIEGISWRETLVRQFGAPGSRRAKDALDEKVLALETLFEYKLSVLVGGAGTGKTSVMRALSEQLAQIEGRQPTLLLAPTGKARVRLAQQARGEAFTIHQFLFSLGWLEPGTNALREAGRQSSAGYTTVILDECSMLSTDLLGTLLRALDMNAIRRLILVGDPSQLPPIGPGRPFYDIIAWLKEEHPECVAQLRVCMRTNAAEEQPETMSVALSLADGYRADEGVPDVDSLLMQVAHQQAGGDLDVVFWRDHDDLMAKLKDRMAVHLGVTPEDSESLVRSLGAIENDWTRCEAWQILSPTRIHPSGADEINRRLQMEYWRQEITAARNPRNNMAHPFGEQKIVWHDKVIQTMNRRMKPYPNVPDKWEFVANGEIGLVSATQAGGQDAGPSLDVVFATQPTVSYRYQASEVNDYLEIAYALTVHKAQGSDFETVFFIVPQHAATLSRELLYTGLTRFRKRLVLLIERDITRLAELRRPEYSDTLRRNTNLFTLALRSVAGGRPFPNKLIHRTTKGVLVRSKSEVIVADILSALGVSYAYEQRLYARNSRSKYYWPDFTVSYLGDTHYWEHLGMLNNPDYRANWERKLQWYGENGYGDRLIISQDGPDGSINAEEIERLVRRRILGEKV